MGNYCLVYERQLVIKLVHHDFLWDSERTEGIER